MCRCEDEFESAWSGRQVGHGFLGFMDGMIVHQYADQDPFGTRGVHFPEKGDELAAAVAASLQLVVPNSVEFKSKRSSTNPIGTILQQ